MTMLCTQARNRSLVVSRGVIIPKSKERRCYEAREEMIGTTKDAVKHKAEKKKTRRAEPYARGDRRNPRGDIGVRHTPNPLRAVRTRIVRLREAYKNWALRKLK